MMAKRLYQVPLTGTAESVSPDVIGKRGDPISFSYFLRGVDSEWTASLLNMNTQSWVATVMVEAEETVLDEIDKKMGAVIGRTVVDGISDLTDEEKQNILNAYGVKPVTVEAREVSFGNL